MKRILAITAAALLVLTALPVFAFTGFETDPGLPEITLTEDALFPVEVKRVENDPVITENEWGEEEYSWTYMESDHAVEPGEDVTFSCEIAVPASLEGFDEEALNSIEVRFSFDGLELNELVMAFGCEPNSYCDFDIGVCYPLPGYANAAIEGDELVVYAQLGSEMQIIVRGIAEADKITANSTVTVGQYDVPAHFSCGKLAVEEDGAYYIYFKDIFNVQLRGMKFYAEDGVFDHYYVCLNGHDYMRSVTRGVSYTEVGNEENVVTEGDAFDALELAYNTYMGFFGFTDDEIADALTPGVFVAGSEPVRTSSAFEFGGEGGDEPEPTEPTEPTDPTDPVNPPDTGAMSLAVIGAAAVLCGAGVVLFKKH